MIRTALQRIGWALGLGAAALGFASPFRAPPRDPFPATGIVRAPNGPFELRVRLARLVEERGVWRIEDQRLVPVRAGPRTQVLWWSAVEDGVPPEPAALRIAVGAIGAREGPLAPPELEASIDLSTAYQRDELVIAARRRSVRLPWGTVGNDAQVPNWPKGAVGSPDVARRLRDDVLARRLLLMRLEDADGPTAPWTLADWRQAYADGLHALIARLDASSRFEPSVDRTAIWDHVALATAIPMPEAIDALTELGKLMDRRVDLRRAEELVPLARLLANDGEARWYVKQAFALDPEPLPTPIHRPEERARYLSRLYVQVADPEVREWVGAELEEGELPAAAAARLAAVADDGRADLPAGLARRVTASVTRRDAPLRPSGALLRLRPLPAGLLLALLACAARTLVAHWRGRPGLAAAGASFVGGLLVQVVQLPDAGWQDALHAAGLLVAAHGALVLGRVARGRTATVTAVLVAVGAVALLVAAFAGGVVWRTVGELGAVAGVVACLPLSAALVDAREVDERAPRRPRRALRSLVPVGVITFGAAGVLWRAVGTVRTDRVTVLLVASLLFALGVLVGGSVTRRAALLRGRRLRAVTLPFVVALIAPLALVLTARLTQWAFGLDGDGLASLPRLLVHSWLFVAQLAVLVRLSDAARHREAVARAG